MRKLVVGLIFSVICFSLTACGGSNSNIRRLARRSSPDDGGDDAPQSAPVNTAGAKTVQKAKSAPASKTNAASQGAPPPPPAAEDDNAKQPAASNEKPPDALSETERRARSMANLEKIGKA